MHERLIYPPGQPPAQSFEFISSGQSQAARARRWLWLGAALGVAAPLLKSGFSAGPLLVAGGMALLFGLLDWLLLRPAARAGQVVFTVTQQALESPRFNTSAKRFGWHDLLGIAVETDRGVPVLQLQLRQEGRRRGLREFLNGVDPSQPKFPLNTLEPLQQEQLVDLLQQRLRGVAAADGRAPTTAWPNVLRQERLFAEQLRALAPRTWVTWAIVALNVAAWLGTLAAGADPLQPTAMQLLALGGNTASEVQQGQWWRLLTAAFLHIGAMHLAMNMLGLLLIAPTVERIYGHRLFLLIYLGAAVAGSAASLHFSARGGVSVGASGAVFGVAGALLLAVLHHRQRLPRMFGKRTLGGIGFFVVYSLVQGLAPGVDNAAHVGGLLAGAALASILPERFDLDHFRRSVRMRAGLAVLFIAATTAAIALTAPPAPFDLSEAFAANAALERGLRDFSLAVKALEQEAREVKAGQLGELEADERSRQLHAPRFRALVRQLSAIVLPANDPRAPLLAAALQVSQLLRETLAMESRIVDGKPVPVDPARSAAISVQLERLNAQMVKLAAGLRPPPRR